MNPTIQIIYWWVLGAQSDENIDRSIKGLIEKAHEGFDKGYMFLGPIVIDNVNLIDVAEFLEKYIV